MAQFGRRGGGQFRGRGRGRGRGQSSRRGVSRYNPSRIQEPEESGAESLDDADIGDVQKEGEEVDVTSSSEDESAAGQDSYSTLLQSLKAQDHIGEPVKKRRKLNASLETALKKREASVPDEINEFAELKHPKMNGSHDAVSKELDAEGVDDVADHDDEDEEDNIGEPVDDAEDEDLSDPFESHFSASHVTDSVRAAQENLWKTHNVKVQGTLRKTSRLPESRTNNLKAPSIRPPSHLKSRILRTGAEAWNRLSSADKDLGAAVTAYQDILYGARTVKNAAGLRDLVCVQALNHVLKTRDRVLKNNMKAARETSGEIPELRDQGFARPKVLFILPTRNACVRYVESLLVLSEPEQQENKSRFLESFASPDDAKEWGDDKPEDFRELFSGNDDDMFRIGLKFTRKTVKLFSQFYTSDIILASPLGLRTAIETSGKNKSHDADFLSSIEIVVVDQAEALLMQNWQHVEYIFSQLNLLPKDAHGCDFTRVRTMYLDNLSKYFRQTIVLSSFLTPEVNSLTSTYFYNHEGLAKYTPVYTGTMLSLPATVPPHTTQTFLRFNSPTPSSDPALRFNYFTTSILPSFLPTARFKPAPGTLIFVPSYFSFLRLQTHLSTDPSCTSLSFASITEYTSVRDVARTRSHFANGRYSLLLYTERAHHFRRFGMIRGVKRIVFFGVPENHLFWPEVCGYLGGGDGNSGEHERAKTESGKGKIKALFSRWDVLKLERIAGTERVGKMIKGEEGDVFEFVSA